MENLQIEIPKGYEIDEDKSTFTNIVFKKIISKITPEEKMDQIWRECTVIKYSSDDCRTYFKDKEAMFQQDWTNNKLYYNYINVYEVFEKEYNMQEPEINNLVIKILSKDINCPTIPRVWVWSVSLGCF